MSAPLQVFSLPLGLLQANCFLLVQGQAALLIDPGDEAALVVDAMTRHGVRPSAILVTHGHYDHVGAVAALAEQYGVRVYAGADDIDEGGAGSLSEASHYRIDPGPSVVALSGEQRLPLPIAVTAIPTPGHSPGSYTFVADSHLFCGDLLENTGKPALNAIMDDPAAASTSLEQLKDLGIRTVYPGHGTAFPLAELEASHKHTERARSP